MVSLGRCGGQVVYAFVSPYPFGSEFLGVIVPLMRFGFLHLPLLDQNSHHEYSGFSCRPFHTNSQLSLAHT